MSIIATFPTGVDEITASGLHQWDYGQMLEIHASDLGNELVEVHFSHPKMAEAVVRSCQLTLGVGSALIPDTCMEQTKPITAWIYAVGETSGETIKTIVMPVIARTRPAPSTTIPQSISDRYTEAVAAMNAAVDAIEDGSIVAAKASRASSADYALLAGSAGGVTEEIGDHAISEIFEGDGTTAKMATKCTGVEIEKSGTYHVLNPGLYSIRFQPPGLFSEYTLTIDVGIDDQPQYYSTATPPIGGSVYYAGVDDESRYLRLYAGDSEVPNGYITAVRQICDYGG